MGFVHTLRFSLGLHPLRVRVLDHPRLKEISNFIKTLGFVLFVHHTEPTFNGFRHHVIFFEEIRWGVVRCNHEHFVLACFQFYVICQSDQGSTDLVWTLIFFKETWSPLLRLGHTSRGHDRDTTQFSVERLLTSRLPASNFL